MDGIRITRNGEIEELRQRNYHGKRVYLNIEDSAGVVITTKLDIGVHVHEEMQPAIAFFHIGDFILGRCPPEIASDCRLVGYTIAIRQIQYQFGYHVRQIQHQFSELLRSFVETQEGGLN